MDHLVVGKRQLAVQDMDSAVTSLALACQLLSEQHGETAKECAEAYLYYGKALLELARLESSVLGGALAGDNQGSQEDDEESQDEDNDDTKDAEEEDDLSDPSEDPSSLQLAWENLEFAKMIFSKKAEEETGEGSQVYSGKLCDTLLTLGEVSLENENYSQAVLDLSACLAVQQETLPKDSRCIAETHYQLAVALGYQCSFEEAEQSLNDAIDVLTTRIENIKADTQSTDQDENNKRDHEEKKREIVELEELLPLIKEKIEDTCFMKQEIIRKLKEQMAFSKDDLEDADKPINNITVKRRN